MGARGTATCGGAAFTDPGWCDTHTATWDFGDCSAPTPAMVTETNEPPAGRGTAVASHVYDHCGTFLARCVVVTTTAARAPPRSWCG